MHTKEHCKSASDEFHCANENCECDPCTCTEAECAPDGMEEYLKLVAEPM